VRCRFCCATPAYSPFFPPSACFVPSASSIHAFPPCLINFGRAPFGTSPPLTISISGSVALSALTIASAASATSFPNQDPDKPVELCRIAVNQSINPSTKSTAASIVRRRLYIGRVAAEEVEELLYGLSLNVGSCRLSCDLNMFPIFVVCFNERCPLLSARAESSRDAVEASVVMIKCGGYDVSAN